jgi:hypothetical protein
MKIGKFKIKKVYTEDKKIKWGVFGRRSFGYPWILCYDDFRNPKELVFDLEYDCCCYLWGFVEFVNEQSLGRSISPRKTPPELFSNKRNNKKINQIKKKRKIAKASRAKNR